MGFEEEIQECRRRHGRIATERAFIHYEAGALRWRLVEFANLMSDQPALTTRAHLLGARSRINRDLAELRIRIRLRCRRTDELLDLANTCLVASKRQPVEAPLVEAQPVWRLRCSLRMDSDDWRHRVTQALDALVACDEAHTRVLDLCMDRLECACESERLPQLATDHSTSAATREHADP